MTGSGLIPHHQADGRREYRSPDGAWRVVRTRQPGRKRNEWARWEVHERPEAHGPWHCHAAFERQRDALVFLDTTAVPPGGESTAAAAAAVQTGASPPNAGMSRPVVKPAPETEEKYPRRGRARLAPPPAGARLAGRPRPLALR